MIAVFYVLAPDPDGAQERRWIRSVQSLRRHNSDVSVVLCLYGRPHPETVETARSAGVQVQPMGEFADALGDIPKHWRYALSRNPSLIKLLALRAFTSAHELTRLIYLDCDTYCFGDIVDLTARYGRCDFYAREEPLSMRSRGGPDRGYIDEQALFKIADAEGLIPIPAYNTGLALLTYELARTLATLLDDYIWYTWRLLLGACLWRPELVDDSALMELVRAHSSEGERRLALPYPSGSLWIIDEIAAWLTLGHVPGLSHDLLRPPDVVQNGEYVSQPADGIITAHYFSVCEEAFVAHLEGR